MIRKKKKKVSIDNNIDNNIYNINEDIIKVENNIIAIINDFPNKNIIKINIDDCIDFNYKFIQYLLYYIKKFDIFYILYMLSLILKS